MVRREVSRALLAGLLVLAASFALMPAPARAEDDLPPRVGRVADLGGELFLAPQDAPDQWIAIGLNYPVATGDNLWVGNEGRAEIDFGSGQFRLAGDTSLHVSRLDDRDFALFVAQGRVILRVHVLDPGEVARIDTPNAQVALTRPGLYRIEVSEDRQHTQLAVREGEAEIDTGTAVQQVLPGQSASLDGAAPLDAQVRNGVTTDGFDTWSANRDRRYARGRVNAPVSRQMVGAADLDEYGAWETAPEYGAVWYPANVAADWAPYRNGYWTDVAAWGPTWVDYAPWGYAPFHYGRWAHIRGRWGWCPGGYVARPVWAPALVGWVGGPGWHFSTRFGSPVYGWVPLGWGEAYHPRWKGCSDRCWSRYNKPYAVDTTVRHSAPPARHANWSAPGAMSAVPGAAFTGRKPVASNLVAINGAAMASAPVLTAPPIRPEIREARGIKPGNGVPPPASTLHASSPRPVRTVTPVGAIPGAGGTVVAPPVSRTAPRVSSPALQAPDATPKKVAPVPAVTTYTPPVQRPTPIQVNPPANVNLNPVAVPPARVETQPRTQPKLPPVAVTPNGAPNGFAGQGSVAPQKVPPVREPRALPSMPAPATLAPAPLGTPAVVPPLPVAPATRALPLAPPAAVPGVHAHENPKADKAAAPAVRVPGEVPVK